MGGTASDALVQQDIWDSLDPKVRHEQAARNEEERELAEAAFDNIVQPPRTVPRISPQTCGGANYYKYYKITSNTQATQCFAGAAGTYTPTTQIVDNGGTTNVRLQAAAYRGRVYYSLGNGHFWSETRGPGDYSWRSFGIAYDQRFVAKRVQLY